MPRSISQRDRSDRVPTDPCCYAFIHRDVGMKERGKGLESEYVAIHALNYRFPFTEKESWDDMEGKYDGFYLLI